MRYFYRWWLSGVFLAASMSALQAKVVLPDILGDNMVLQQQTVVRLWGWAKPGVSVTAKPSWDDSVSRTQAGADGKWLLTVETPEADYTSHSLVISDGEEVTLRNILVGEVWFCSGQSNMEMPLAGFDNCPVEGANEAIATASEWKGIRMATIEKNGQLEPVDSCRGSWRVSCPAYAPRFGATAFFFARMMNRVLDMPVGIINCSWGGSTVEGWLPEEIVSQYPDIDLERDIRKEEPHDWWHYLSPTLMYNGMVRPLQNYTVKGFLWYQGESNVGKHDTYGERLKTMVELWRKEWRLGELPFYFVELAPYGSTEGLASAFLREAQHEAERLIPNSGVVCTNDLVEPYEAWNVHPKDKRSVGERLAYLALAKTYGLKGIKADSPTFRKMRVEGSEAILEFDHAEGGFSRVKYLEDFEMAGADRVFHRARAEVKGNCIHVVCGEIARPVAVRYAFRDYFPGNVSDLRGLPLVPFRTDRW